MKNLSREQKIQHVKSLHKNGKTITEISLLTNIPRATIFDWVTGRKRNVVSFEKITEVSDYDENDNRVDLLIEDETETQTIKSPFVNIPSDEANKEGLMEFIMNIRPISYPAPTKPRVYSTPNKIAMVIGDTHFGIECWNTLNIFLQIVEEIKPEKIILNGDTLDMFSISKYSKDPRHSIAIDKEVSGFHKFLKLLHDVTEPYQTEILETNGNHSGNGQEGRWWRFLSENLGSIAASDLIAEKLSYKNVFYPNESWSRIKLVDSINQESMVELPNEMFVFHGDIVRKNGGYSARATFEKRYASTITNHTHRIGSSCQRIPSIGTRKERIITNFENGCACDLNPSYVSGANWQNGFSIVNYSEGITGVETVIMHNKKATVCSLNKTFKVN